jgi:hypothetical protein
VADWSERSWERADEEILNLRILDSGMAAVHCLSNC